MIPKKGSIPRRKPAGKSVNGLLGGLNNLLGGALQGVGKIVENLGEGVKNLNLKELEKLVVSEGDAATKEKIQELKDALGDDFLSNLKEINFGKLVEFAAKHGGDFSQEFSGEKGLVRTGLSGHILGKPIGEGSLPLNQKRSQEQETNFEVKGGRSAGSKIPAGQSKAYEIDFDPIEEKNNHLIIRGYLAGVEEKDIICEIQKDGTILKISAKGERRYETEILLPSKVTPEVEWTFKNGILEITLDKEI